MKPEHRPPDAASLRARAEAVLLKTTAPSPESLAALSPEAAQRVLHELQVHQIELEMQNEELRRAQLELEASRASYFDLYDLAPVGYCTVGGNGIISEANLTLATFLGVARGALVVQLFSSFILKDDADIFYLLKKQVFAAHATGADPAAPSCSCELRLKRGDGTPVWVGLVVTAAKGESGETILRVAVTDISAQRANEAIELEKAEIQAAILNAIPAQVTLIDPEGIIVATNERRQRFATPNLPQDSDFSLGQNYLKVCERATGPFSEEAKDAAAGIRRVLGGEVGEFSIEYPCHSNTEQRWFRLVVNPLHEGIRKGALLMHFNITEQRQLQNQLRESQKMEAIGQLAGGIAHDFNNILAVIQGYSTLLLAAPSVADVAEAAENIGEAAGRGEALTRQLLAYSRQQVLKPRVLDLNKIVSGFLKMLGRLLGEDLRIVMNLDSRALLTRADAGMLEQVLMNLAVNARDAMPDGGRLEVATGEVTLKAAEADLLPDLAPGHHVWLSVSDTGCGIPPEQLARIFEPFFTTKDVGKGTGLGLATAHGIVKQHGGAMTVASEVGRGTTFKIYLPATEAEVFAPVIQPAAPAALGGWETILLVEDDPTIRKLTRRVLERAGYRVLEAADGVEGGRLGEEHSGEIRLLLTDITMPEGVSGRMLATQLEAKNPQLKVIFTSGYDVTTARRGLSLNEGEDFLQKPVPLSLLLETVRRSLDR